MLTLSLIYLAAKFAFHRSPTILSPSKTSAVKWRYEIPSQILRGLALIFVVEASVRKDIHRSTTLLLGYAFILGLVRLGNNLRWRLACLRQLNIALLTSFTLICLSQLLPCIQQDYVCERPQSVTASVGFLGAALLIAAFTPAEWMPPPQDIEIPGYKPATEPSAEEACSWFTYYCTYSYLNPVMWKGMRMTLDSKGIPFLSWYDEPLWLLHRLHEARAISRNTLWTTIRYQRQELSGMAFWSSLAFVAENIAPYAMFMLLAYIDTSDDNVYRPYLWVALLFIGPMSRSIFYQQYLFQATRTLVRIKSGMTQELYHRAIHSMELEDDPFQTAEDKAKAKKKKASEDDVHKTTSSGRLASLMAADVDAVQRGRDIMLILVGIPIGTTVSLVGLYKMMGWSSIVGMAVLFLSVPISGMLSRLMFFTQRQVRKVQDARISLVTEYLGSIRAIKYFAWENAIINKIVASRAQEQKSLWKMTVLSVWINQVAQAIPLISLCVMFTCYVSFAGQRLDASTAFTAVTLVKSIRRNIMMASGLARACASAFVAFGRLDKYFESTVPMIRHPEGPLRINKARFRKNKQAAFILDNISIDFVDGGLNVIIGQSGSGKSTLLLSILGETYLEAGTATAPADIAYASQSAWLQNDSIQNNILFGQELDQLRYQRILSACCLNVDLRELKDGDQTSIGENGTSLSGGQRARVALGRALYSQAPLLLLDDIFSALDAKTSAGVWKRCFCTDLLAGRTTVLVTQVPWIAEQADLAVELERGLIKSNEPHIGVVRKPITIAEVLGGDDDGDDDEIPETPAEPELAANSDALNDPAKVTDNTKNEDIVDQETKATGRIGRLTFLEYMGYFGHPLFGISIIIGLFVSNIFFFGSSFWLSIWVGAYEKSSDVNIAFYLGIYAALSFVEVASFGFIVTMFEWGAWRAGRTLHNTFVRSVMHAPLSWFNKIPIGRITNRFAGDMASIDSNLSPMLRIALDTFMMFFFRIASISTIMPIFMIPSTITCLFGIFIGEIYTRTAVIIRRLTSSAQSPVFSQFADTLAGLAVIRGRHGKSQSVQEDLADRLRVWSATSESNYNCNRWVAVRVDFVTSIISLLAGLIAIKQTGTVSAGLVGFSLSNANGLNQTILWLVRAMNDLEVEIQSFHRVKEYAKLEPESKDDTPYPDEGEFTDNPAHVIPKNWPRSGDIEFRDVTVRYDPEGSDILTNVNLKFKAGERVAVIGRTGSGKSTLVLSLLRFTHIVSGQILYDGVDITKVSRERLREGLTIIPQEAVLFNGTVQSNLDPSGDLPEEVLEQALDNCRGIASFSGNNSSASDDDGENERDGRSGGILLSTDVDAKGENFSHGQRQVLSLCRALIRKSKLMLLDEATASMDYETDRGIQRVLRDELEESGRDRTLVTIAHRLRTIIDYDTVVVMSAGKVIE